MNKTPPGSVAALAHDESAKPLLQGVLQKWTNYILGWQERYFVVKQDCLLYFKSESEAHLGCRGAVNLSDASVVAHETDERRFDVRILDFIWYMRAKTSNERQLWLNCLIKFSVGDPQKMILEEKVEKVVALGDEIGKEVDLMVNDFEKMVSEVVSFKSSDTINEKIMEKIRNYSVTLSEKRSKFETTTGEFKVIVSECVNHVLTVKLLSRVKSSESLCVTESRLALTPGAEESEHCVLSDEEFFDAVESRLEKIEEEAVLRRRLENSTADTDADGSEDICSESFSSHSFDESVRRVTEDQIRSAADETDCADWTLVADQGNLKLFSRELVVDGVAIDPLKAVCTVSGITGREVCHYFFHPEYRKDWETALERMTVVKKVDRNTLVFHQVYKKVWPAAQRDTLFWSHLTSRDSPDSPKSWAVVNHSTDLPQFPAGEFVRVTFSVCLLCTTVIAKTGAQLSRDNISCRITYSSTLNPGGWVPVSAVRALRRIEYPKFLKKFTSYVVERTSGKEILI